MTTEDKLKKLAEMAGYEFTKNVYGIPVFAKPDDLNGYISENNWNPLEDMNQALEVKNNTVPCYSMSFKVDYDEVECHLIKSWGSVAPSIDAIGTTEVEALCNALLEIGK